MPSHSPPAQAAPDGPTGPRRAGAHAGRIWTELRRVNPAPGAWRVALRAALTMEIALTTLAALGQMRYGLYACFGVFASIYGGRVPTPQRWRLQARHGFVMASCVLIGVLVALHPDRAWISVPVATLLGGWAAAMSDRQRWFPPGPVFCLFAMAGSASVPADPRHALVAVLAACATVVVAVLLGVFEARWLPLRGEHGPPPPHPADTATAGRQRLHAVRCAVAVAIAGSIATASGIGHPYWAMVASVVPLGVAGMTSQVVRSVNRALGTLAGLPVAAAIIWLDLPLILLVAVMSVVQGIVELTVVRHYGIALVFITPLALVMGHLADPTPVDRLLTERMLETLIGLAVGVAIAILTRPRRVPLGRRS